MLQKGCSFSCSLYVFYFMLANYYKKSHGKKQLVVSIGGFLSIPISFLYSGNFSFKIQLFFYSYDIIVSQKMSI